MCRTTCTQLTSTSWRRQSAHQKTRCTSCTGTALFYCITVPMTLSSMLLCGSPCHYSCQAYTRSCQPCEPLHPCSLVPTSDNNSSSYSWQAPWPCTCYDYESVVQTHLSNRLGWVQSMQCSLHTPPGDVRSPSALAPASLSASLPLSLSVTLPAPAA